MDGFIRVFSNSTRIPPSPRWYTHISLPSASKSLEASTSRPSPTSAAETSSMRSSSAQ